MRIQEAFSNCCTGIKDFAVSAGAFIGRSFSTAGSYISSTASKVAEFAKPHFAKLKEFAANNQQPLMLAAAAVAVGVVVAIIAAIFCRSTNTNQQSQV